MDYIWNVFVNSFFFDGKWWKDYGIPLLGAIAVPMLIWLLTWFYGAGRAEKQKELTELRDNLNLLISLLCGYATSLFTLRRKIIQIQQKMKQIKNLIEHIDNPSLFSRFTSRSFLERLDVAKYSPCLQYDEDFLVILMRIQDMAHQLDYLCEDRNNSLRSMVACEDAEAAANRYLSFLMDQPFNLDQMLNLIDACLYQEYNFFTRIKNIESHIKGLKLNTIEMDDPSFFEKIKQEYEDRNKNERVNNE